MPKIDLTPTWPEFMAMLIALIESGTPSGKAYARAELMNLARKLEADKETN